MSSQLLLPLNLFFKPVNNDLSEEQWSGRMPNLKASKLPNSTYQKVFR